ncbi:MAG: cell division protein ZapA [Candidatus Pelagibacter sp. TMED118]|nr:MAG: cell division protein ZapA [Candidatus Pelagibacter sp. TMED118]|tara:strand:+ start:2901 stop:3344 length:444 start_codon:yes stop_codon:yes gene_type:complete
MANVNIKFNGKEYLLSCEDGQEEHLEELSLRLNNKFEKLKVKLGNIGESKLLLISSITIMDEYFETRKKIELQKKELDNLKDKFKEIKTLVYDYKDDKEMQILNLNKSLSEVKTQIEQTNNDFDKIIDNTTKEIEKFIQRSISDTQI